MYISIRTYGKHKVKLNGYINNYAAVFMKLDPGWTHTLTNVVDKSNIKKPDASLI